MDRYYVDDTPIGPAIVDDNSDGQIALWARDYDLSREQIDFAALLLNAGVEVEDVTEMVALTACSVCAAEVMDGQVDASGRCVECQP